jgi:outer membrane protein
MHPLTFVKITLLCLLTFVTCAVQADDLVLIHQQARDYDPVFRAADAARLSAREAFPQSRALLLPTITLSASRSEFRQDDLSGTPFPLAATDTQGYTLSLRQPLFHRDYFTRLSQADTRVAQAEINYAIAEQTLIIRTAQQYFDTLAAQDNLDFSLAEKKALERQLEQTRHRFDVGLIAITDVQEAQAAYDLVNAQTIEAENLLASQREALRELTNQYHNNLAVLGDELPLIAPEPADIEQWSQQSLQNNLNLQVSQLDADAALDDIHIYEAGHLPQFDLNASQAYSDSNGAVYSGETRNRSITLQLTVPLYQGGNVNSQVRAAQARYQQANEVLEQTRRSILRQARDGYRGVLAAIDRVKALQQAVVSAQTALTATEAGLEVGTRTTVDVLGVRRNLFRAQRDLARARYDYILYTLKLKQVSGQLQSSDLAQVNQWLR